LQLPYSRHAVARCLSVVTPTIVIFLLLLIGTSEALAHERWILSPSQVLEWNSRPKPALYTTLQVTNALLVGGALLFVLIWIRLGSTGARELFPDLQLRLASYGDFSAVILRIGLAWALLTSAVGLEPRFGNVAFASPTLFAPDLELALLDPAWHWLRPVEITLGLMFLFGVFVRLAAAALIGLLPLALVLFGQDMLAYFFAYLGVAIYLLLQGPGRWFVPVPLPTFVNRVERKLESVPRQRAQFLLRVLAGFNFLYLGIYFKVLQPNLALAIVTIYEVPVLSWAPEAFVLIMALVEVVAGLMLMAGVLMRPMSLFILGAMLFFASVLPESFTAHMLLYGILLTFVFNSAGHWEWPRARDKAGHIVIVGGGFAAVRGAMRLEKLRGRYSNVRVTVVHERGELLFSPLLPEVVGGTVQPGNIVNPLRRILDRTAVIKGQVETIDTGTHSLSVRRRSGVLLKLDYDQLIMAHEPTPELEGPPGLVALGQPIDSIGDALYLRQTVLDALAEAEQLPPGEERKKHLTFTVVGGGERGCGTALEIGRLVKSALPTFPTIESEEIKLVLFQDPGSMGARVPAGLRAARDRMLARQDIELMPEALPRAVTPDGVVCESGRRILCKNVVNARYRFPVFPLPGATRDGFLVADSELRLRGMDNVWVASSALESLRARYVSLATLNRLGTAAAYNAWAATQGFKAHPFRPALDRLRTYFMGRYSIGSLYGVGFSGLTAWLIARLRCLTMLPGLERNLRVIIDWLLDVPFRNDIAVLAPERTQTLGQLYYETGDVVIREGDAGDAAYLVRFGTLKVLKQGQEVSTAQAGDCIGEIALLMGIPRTTTVVCTSPVSLTVLTRDQFLELSGNFKVLDEALRRQISMRLQRSTAEA
jgi:NADH dehydrogenase FAD-containing subunit/uncharacterized membrane protein YphA (DoxX/SURF4 family)